MIDQLRALDRDHLARLLEESHSWPDRGRARRQRLTRQIVCDWARLVACLPEDPRHRTPGATPMKISSMFPSKYLRAADLDGEDATVTIRSLEISDDFEDGPKPILHFEGGDRGLVLNRTNAGAIAAVLGNESDAWVGRQITLYVAQVPYQGRVVDAIRVKVPRKAAGLRQKLTALADDDLPL